MEGIERFEEIQQIPDDSEIEGLAPGEVNLASAEKLIERLEAVGTLSPSDIEAGENMVKDLELQIKSFNEEHLTIPPKLTFVVEELNRLIKNEPISVRDLMEVKELEPDDPAIFEAEKERRELEGLLN